MELLHADRTLALEAIERADSIHSGYLKYAMNIDWTDPSLHDLTINASRFPTDRAVEVIAGAAAVLGYRRRARKPGAPAPSEASPPPLPETAEEEPSEEPVGAGRGA